MKPSVQDWVTGYEDSECDLSIHYIQGQFARLFFNNRWVNVPLSSLQFFEKTRTNIIWRYVASVNVRKTSNPYHITFALNSGTPTTVKLYAKSERDARNRCICSVAKALGWSIPYTQAYFKHHPTHIKVTSV